VIYQENVAGGWWSWTNGSWVPTGNPTAACAEWRLPEQRVSAWNQRRRLQLHGRVWRVEPRAIHYRCSNIRVLRTAWRKTRSSPFKASSAEFMGEPVGLG
jgi:hypothetical protein